MESKPFKILFDSMPIGLINLSSDLTIIDWNPSAEKIFEFNKTEILGKNPSGLIFPLQSNSTIIKITEQLKKDRKTQNSIFENLTKSGKIITCEWINTPLFDENGNFTGILAMVNDITEKVEAENKLKYSEYQLSIRNKIAEAFLTISDIHIYSEIINILKVEFNSSEGFLGYINRNQDLVVPSLIDEQDNNQSDSLKNNLVFQNQIWIKNVWGQTLNEKKAIIINSPRKVPNGHKPVEKMICVPIIYKEKSIGLILLANKQSDYTQNDSALLQQIADNIAPILEARLARDFQEEERKKAEEEVIKSRDFYLTVLEEFPALIWRTGKDGLINYVNKEWISFTGHHSKTNITDKLTQGIFLKDQERCLNTYRNAFIAREPFQIEYRLKHFRGDYRWVVNYGRPIYDLNNQFLGYIGVCYDIDDRIKNHRELVESKEKAEESDRLKSAFLANISHEIRTPLNGILGFSQLIINESINLEKRKLYFKHIHQSSQELLTVINNIIDIAKLATNQIDFSFNSFNLNEIMNELFCNFRNDLLEKNKSHIELMIIKGLPSEDCYIETDESRIKQILSNLLDNAIKFTNKGFIEFGYNILEEPNINIGNNKPTIQFYVKDTGVGISKDFQRKLFHYFRQEDDSETRKFGGLGLGLAVSKGIVELLGGAMNLESEKGKGTTIFFTIPYKKGKYIEENVLDTDVEIDIKLYDWKGASILVVDDLESVSMYFAEILEQANAKTLFAKSGMEAVQMCKLNPGINLVLMDLNLPDISGLEATKLIKEFRPKLPVIAQTAYILSSDRKKALNAGCDDYISKPINKDELFDKINKFIFR